MQDRIEAYILGGGRSSRYGSDKCLAETAGISFLEAVFQVLDRYFPRVTLVASGERKWDRRQIADLYEVRCSMNGILTALSDAESDLVFIASCDMPFITEEGTDRLCRAAAEGNVSCLAASEGQVHYGFGCYARTLLLPMREAMERGDYALHRFMQGQIFRTVELDEGQLRNINRPSDLRDGPWQGS